VTGPTIILLNGSSSAGKSSLARSLQKRLDPQPVIMGLDAFVFDPHPPGWRDTPHGYWFTTEPDGSVPVHMGPGGQALLRAFHRAVAVMADCGLSVIVDDVLFAPWLLPDWLEATAGHEVFFVGVRCDLAEAERREIARGDRQIGQVRSHFSQVHAHGDYDLTVDTTDATPGPCADQIVAALAARTAPSAFQRLRG